MLFISIQCNYSLTMTKITQDVLINSDIKKYQEMITKRYNIDISESQARNQILRLCNFLVLINEL